MTPFSAVRVRYC